MFEINHYQLLLHGVDHAGDSAAKGKSLEDLLVYLLSDIPGIADMERNRLNAFGTEELDIAVINTAAQDGLAFLPTVLLVECKNWSHAVDSAAVTYFASRVKNRGCEVGVLVAAAGLTGRAAGPTAAHFEAAVALARDGIRILVVTLSDLRSITCTSELVALLRRRLLQVIASGTYLPP